MKTIAKPVLVTGQRVRLNGQWKWAIVIEWPPAMVEDLNRLQATHAAVQIESPRDGEEPRQFWPRTKIRLPGENDTGPAPRRPFRDDD